MIRCLLGLVLVFVAGLAMSAPAVQLFEAEVPLVNKSSAETSDAIRRALKEVLIAVTGNAAVAATPGGKAMLAQSDRLLQQYQVNGPVTSRDDLQPTLLLQARFDRRAVLQQLQEHGLTGASLDRPQTLVWMAVEKGAERVIVSADSELPLAARFIDTARRRGMPVLYPLMDLEDRSRVRFTDVWGGYIDTVRQASRRYDLSALLLGRLEFQGNDQWSAEWIYWSEGRQRRMETRSSSVDDVMALGVELMTNQLPYAATDVAGHGSGNQLHLIVEGVESATDYTRVSHYLQSLAPVRRVQITGVQDNELQLLIELQGGSENLAAAIRQDSVLETLSELPNQRYRLRP